jgi:aspartyl-tRNA(Asn)/glutamyl-tRNA(Gln) amidotransferase subunit B
MAEGSLRCDANVSVALDGDEELGERVELKNINSFKFVKDGLIYEIARHVAVLEGGGTVEEATRRYDPKAGRTVRMRSKETAADYRYMPDPDLPPIRIGDARVTRCREAMGEPPAERRRRFREVFGLETEQAAVLCDNRAVAEYAERVAMRATGEVSDNGAREVFEASVDQPTDERESPKAVVERLGLRQVSDRERLRDVVDEVFEQNPAQLEQLRDGDDGLVGWFIGQVMQATGGSADPQVVREMLEDEVGAA